MVNHWHISKTKEAQEWTNVVLQLKYQSKTNTGHLKLPLFSVGHEIIIILIRSPHIPFWRSFKISPTCHTLSKAFEIPRNNSRTSRPTSKALIISWLIESSWLMQESSGLKPGCVGDIKSFLKNSWAFYHKAFVQLIYHR